MAPALLFEKTAADPTFAGRVRSTSGVAVERCYQCLTCTLGCDAAFAMDIPPHRIVRMVQLGLKEAVLQSRSIWVCTACEACVTRCPNEIDIPHLMDTLHQMALAEGVPAAEPTVPVFHRAFLAPVKQFGRQFEALMTGLYLVQSRQFSLRNLIANARIGVGLLKRGKLKFTPHTIKAAKAIGDIFGKTVEGPKT